ncbi:MAG: hypothetical protein AAES65_13105 [Candidatus Thiodiazotropha sp. (ex. Lucinoma kazani)]
MDKTALKRLLKRVHAVNEHCGFLAWDPAMIEQRPLGDPGPGYPRLYPSSTTSPRLFMSYGWSRDEKHHVYESDLWVDAFAGWLFGRGYEIWFDRDPRNFELGLNAYQVLVRMNDCNYYIPVITNEFVERVSNPNGVGPLVWEWEHALRMYPRYLTIIAIWLSGDLPAPLSAENTVDIRDEPSPWGERLEAIFPKAAPGKLGVPRIPAPERPPDPESWPALIPY